MGGSNAAKFSSDPSSLLESCTGKFLKDCMNIISSVWKVTTRLHSEKHSERFMRLSFSVDEKRDVGIAWVVPENIISTNLEEDREQN